ncbi:MAG: ATP-dependent zinc metalloprotease FtsH [Campylobacterales bacterium]
MENSIDNLHTKDSKNPPYTPKQSRMLWRNVWIAIISSMALLYIYSLISSQNQIKELSYSTFMEKIEKGEIDSVSIDKDVIIAKKKQKEDDKTQMPVFYESVIPPMVGEGFVDKLKKEGIEIGAKSQKDSTFLHILISILPWMLFLGLIIYWSYKTREEMMGGVQGGPFSFMHSRAKKMKKQSSSKRYKDVAGAENAKKELAEIVEFMKDPTRFEKIGAKVPKGVLLVGPPGTGKTLLAKAVAGEADAPFFYVSGSEFVEMLVGIGASRVRDMFKKAKEHSPSIVFIDEIDAIGRMRGAGIGGGHDEKEQTLNQILAEMDGFESHEQVVVLAATNRPDILDKALLRPGRFDRKITLHLPDKDARKEIFSVHLKKIKNDENIDINELSKITIGFSGADIENMVNEAAIYAAREKRGSANRDDMLRARDRIVMGLEQELSLDESDRRRIATHECGHTLAAYLLKNTDPVEKVSIIPRSSALGATEQLPTKERKNFPYSYLIDKVGVMLGGRVAERVVYDELSSGAMDDLKSATSLVNKMVCQFGMSKELGPVFYNREEENVFLGKEMTQSENFGEETARLLDEEVRRVLRDKEESLIKLFDEHRESINKLTDALMDQETLYKEEIEKILKKSGAL